MRRLLVGIGVLVLLYLGASWALASLAIEYRDMIDYSDSEWVAIYAPEWDVPVSETVEIQSGDKTLIGDVYLNPADADCGVMIMHGLGGERGLVRQMGPLFYDLGCHVMSYDFAPRNNDVLLSYGYTEKDDFSNVLAWFSDYTDLSPEKIGVWGGSYGAATTIQALPNHQDLAFVIADSSFASFKRILNDQLANNAFGVGLIFQPMAFQIIEWRLGIDMDDVAPNASIIGNQVPILLIHSETDSLIPVDNSQSLYRANQARAQLVITDWGSEHVESYYDNKAQYTAIVYDFLAEVAPDFGQQ